MSFFLSTIAHLVNIVHTYTALLEHVMAAVHEQKIPFLSVDWTMWFKLVETRTMTPCASRGDRSAIRFLHFVSIDRGVADWMVFKTILDAFPALEVLMFDQNYSISPNVAFLDFLRSTHVRLIIYRDSQTECNGAELLHEWCPQALSASGATLVIMQEISPAWDGEAGDGCILCDEDDTASLCCRDDEFGTVRGLDSCYDHSGQEVFATHVLSGAGCTFRMHTIDIEARRQDPFLRTHPRVDHVFSRTYAQQLLVQRKFYWSRLKPQLVEWSIGLQDLELPALVTQTIFEQFCDDAALIPMFVSWDVITRVKHFLRNNQVKNC
jgi:hypothetical protein